MKRRTIETLAQFANAAKNKSSEAIYNMIEDRMSDACRMKLYDLCPGSVEPYRAGCIIVGKFYNVKSLINY